MDKDKILIIEDDLQFVTQIKFQLEKSGYEVVVVEAMENVEMVQEIIFQNMPNLIFCDILMHPNGFDILETIKNDPQLRLIPFIFVSAVESLPERVRAYLSGVDDYIIKPVNLEELLAKIKSVMRRQRQVETAIYMDPLTQVYNRRFFQKELQRQINLHRRHGDQFILALMDLDHFKAINDTYGHQCGDECLIGFADFIKSQIRNTDILSRWGGEEFFLIMVRSQKEGVANTLQNILDKLLSDVKIRCDEHDIKLSFSAGIAQYPINGKTAVELIKAADQAVYRAKELGRGRVEFAEI